MGWLALRFGTRLILLYFLRWYGAWSDGDPTWQGWLYALGLALLSASEQLMNTHMEWWVLGLERRLPKGWGALTSVDWHCPGKGNETEGWGRVWASPAAALTKGSS